MPAFATKYLRKLNQCYEDVLITNNCQHFIFIKVIVWVPVLF